MGDVNEKEGTAGIEIECMYSIDSIQISIKLNDNVKLLSSVTAFLKR